MVGLHLGVVVSHLGLEIVVIGIRYPEGKPVGENDDSRHHDAVDEMPIVRFAGKGDKLYHMNTSLANLITISEGVVEVGGVRGD